MKHWMLLLCLLGLLAPPAMADTTCVFPATLTIAPGNLLGYASSATGDTLTWSGKEVKVDFDGEKLLIDGQSYPQFDHIRASLSDESVQGLYGSVPLIQELRDQGKTWQEAYREFQRRMDEFHDNVEITFHADLLAEPDKAVFDGLRQSGKSIREAWEGICALKRAHPDEAYEFVANSISYVNHRTIAQADYALAIEAAQAEAASSPFVDTVEHDSSGGGVVRLRIVFRGMDNDELMEMKTDRLVRARATFTKEDACWTLEQIEKLGSGEAKVFILGVAGFQIHGGAKAEAIMARLLHWR